MNLSDFFKSKRLLPVVTIDDASDAIALAETLLECGIDTIEITLRTADAFNAIKCIANALPQMQLAAGTVLNPSQCQQAIDCGASIIISPGYTMELCDYCQQHDIAYLPGCVTPAEVMQLHSKGFQYLKFFPAQASGGVERLNVYGSLFADIKFCPTGGINANNASDYLALDNVVAIGASSIAPQQCIKEQDWKQIKMNISHFK